MDLSISESYSLLNIYYLNLNSSRSSLKILMLSQTLISEEDIEFWLNENYGNSQVIMYLMINKIYPVLKSQGYIQ